MVSIIIPAYNEEAVIGRTLTCLLDGADLTDLEIVVACNGCKDRTAEIARSFGPPVQVLETSKGSKTGALNMGDAAARTFPRIYLDADILLPFSAIKSIIQALTDPKSLAVAPRMRVDLTGRSWLIRSFYEVWLKTPYHLRGMIGSGVYALSEEGRKRFREFPSIIADDGYVHAHFAPEERRIVEDCSFTIIPPTTFGALLRIKTRATLGKKELLRKFPELMRKLAESEGDTGKSDYWALMAQPLLWPKIVVYVLVKSVASLRAKDQLKKLSTYEWERDESSRV